MVTAGSGGVRYVDVCLLLILSHGTGDRGGVSIPKRPEKKRDGTRRRISHGIL